MKKIAAILILCIAFPLFLFGCGKEEETANTMIANPWTSHANMEEAEKAVGFAFGLPDNMGN